jgi:N-acetylated-alpha-linked acidic dipeptidase
MDERTPLIQTVVVTRRERRFPHSTFRRFCSLALSICLLVVVIGFLVPYHFFSDSRGHLHNYLPWSTPFPQSWPQSNGLNFSDLQDIVLNTPSPERARDWSKYYTSGPHLAGKNLSQAIWTRERWEELGVKSEIVAYDVYLSYPLDHRLALLDGKKVKYECNLKEDILEEDPTTAMQDIPTFHGYSGSGNVTAQYVYANFGTVHDFDDLVKAGIDLEGKIALVKYGRVFRGLKVKRAQELGMVGVVIYSDPQEDGDITEENGYKTYPAGPARNPSSVQRGSAQYISLFFVTALTQADRCRRRPPR